MDEKKNKCNKSKETENSNECKKDLAKENQALISENENLKKELEEAKKQADDFKDKWMRNVAEFDNYKKRNAKLWQDAYEDGMKETVLKIVSIGDNLDRALSMGLEPKTEEGIKNLKRQFNDSLSSIGVEEINPVGEKFDYKVAEAVMQVEKGEDEESETVKMVFEKGYKLKDKVIKYAKVSVTK